MLSGLMDLLLLDSSSNKHVLAANLVLLMLHELLGRWPHCESRVNVSHGSAVGLGSSPGRVDPPRIAQAIQGASQICTGCDIMGLTHDPPMMCDIMPSV